MNFSIYFLVFILSGVLTYCIQKIFIHYKKFDDINHRSSHKTLATRTGGIGVFLTVLIISLFYYSQNIEIFDYSLFIPLGIMFIVGVYDDFYNADFKLKFLLQIIVAKILIDQGYVISNYYGIFGLYEVPWPLAQVTSIFVFLVVVNASNKNYCFN
jgi:UDP-GlcNAc:undecaprenyl-phosphate GlcNAc-1-phosphate transferase